MELCDDLRDQKLVDLGVRLEDKMDERDRGLNTIKSAKFFITSNNTSDSQILVIIVGYRTSKFFTI